MGVSLRCRRYILFSYIVILMLSSITAALCGAWLLLELYYVSHGLVLSSSAWSTSGALLCCGVVAMLASMHGWKATARRKCGKIKAFTWLLVLLAIASFAVCGVSLALRHSVAELSASHVEKSFEQAQYGDKRHEKFWEAVQNEQQCCGLDGPADYRRHGVGISWSCCTTLPVLMAPHQQQQHLAAASAQQSMAAVSAGNGLLASSLGVGARNSGLTGGSCAAVYQRGCLDVLIDRTRTLLVYTACSGLIYGLILGLGIFCSVQLSSALETLAKITRRASMKQRQSVRMQSTVGSKYSPPAMMRHSESLPSGSTMMDTIAKV